MSKHWPVWYCDTVTLSHRLILVFHKTNRVRQLTYARCPVRAFAALMFRPQPPRYLVIMQNCIIWLPAIYIHAREYGTITCRPCSPPYPASTLPLTGESCFSEKGASNLCVLHRSCLHEVTPAKSQCQLGLLTFVPSYLPFPLCFNITLVVT